MVPKNHKILCLSQTGAIIRTAPDCVAAHKMKKNLISRKNCRSENNIDVNRTESML
jgi:hypothetical protein